MMLFDVLTENDIGTLVACISGDLGRILHIQRYRRVPRLNNPLIGVLIKLLRVSIKPENPDELTTRRAAVILADALDRCANVDNAMDAADLLTMIDYTIAKYKAVGWIQDAGI